MNASIASLFDTVKVSSLMSTRGRLVRPEYDSCVRAILHAIEAVGGDAEYADITDRTPFDQSSIKECIRDLVSSGEIIVIRKGHNIPNSYLLPHMIEV